MASAIILLPFYIHYLSIEVYGTLTIGLAFSAIVQIITAYSFDSSLYIHYHEFRNDPNKLNSFISAAFIFMLALGIGVSVVALILGQFIFAKVLPGSTLSFFPYGIMAVGVGVCQAIFKVHGNLLQTREKPEVFFWSNVCSFAVIALATVVGLKIFPGTLIGPLGGRLLAALGAAAWALFRVFREFGFHVASPWKHTSRKFNAYTFIYQVQQWVINYVDRFIILFFMPVAAMSSVGLYEFAIKCLAPIELLLNGLNASIFPKVIKLISGQEGKKASTPEINRYFYGQISVIMLMICLSILFLPWLVDWFVHKSNYASALSFVPYLAIIFIFRSMRLYFVLPYNVLKKMKTLTILSFFVALIKVGLMAIFIFQWQIFGLIAASALAYALEMVLLGYYLKQDYEMKFNSFKLIMAPLFLFLMIALIEPFFGDDYPTVLHLGYGFVCAVLLWFSYRNEWKLVNPLQLIK